MQSSPDVLACDFQMIYSIRKTDRWV